MVETVTMKLEPTSKSLYFQSQMIMCSDPLWVLVNLCEVQGNPHFARFTRAAMLDYVGVGEGGG